MLIAISGAGEVAILLSLLVIPAGIIALALALMRRRSVYQAWPTMSHIDLTSEGGEPLACGFAMRAPGAYRVVYPLGTCRISPSAITVALNRRGWAFGADESAVHAESGRFGARLVLSSATATIEVWPLNSALRSRLAMAGWRLD